MTLRGGEPEGPTPARDGVAGDAEATLRESEEKFRAVADTAMDAIISADAQGRILYLNGRAEAMFGYPKGELEGRPLTTLMPERFRELHRRGLERFLSTGRAAVIGQTVELAGLRKNGDEFPLELSLACWATPQGAFFTAILRDITERKQTEAALEKAHVDLERRVQERTVELSRTNALLRAEVAERRRAETERALLLDRERTARSQAEEASRLKDEFLATLSHELRTPLNAIVGWAALLEEGTLDPATAERAVATISRNARLQSQLVSDILDVSRIITGKVGLSVRPVDLASVAEAALDTLKPAAETKGLVVETVLHRDTGPVTGDPDRLQQVLWNLLSNSVKFTPAGGRIRVALRQEGPRVEFSVQDTGCGITAGFLPHVFDRFRQADSSSTRPHRGLGLGLAIVRHITELHGGTVEAESPGEGLGATFTLRLPVTKLDQAEGPGLTAERVPDPGGEAAATDLRGIRVLVVDDEADSRQLIAEILEARGAEVATAGSVPEALAALERARPDVLLSDIEMPGEDGYSLIRKVRALASGVGARLPAGALTAYAGSDDRIRALSSGYQIHLPKPVQPAELTAVVASLARRT